jgi:O-antigen/teichoic acid export membrane protein
VRKVRRTASSAVTIAVTAGLLALGIGLIAGGTHVALGVVVTAWGMWSILVWCVARRGSERLVTAAVLLRPFTMGTFLLALAAVIIAGKRSLDWVVILPIGVAWIGLGVWLLWIYRRSLRRHFRGGEADV